MKTLLAILVLLFCSPFALADLSATSSVDDTLDALYNVGKDLKSFYADVKMNENDQVSQYESSRSGKIWYDSKGEGNARVRVSFEKRIDDRGTQDQMIDYLLDSGWLVERNYPKKQETRRQLRPGEKINLFKLGEGPFPLPIGQKREDVLKQFDVQKVELATGELPNTVHLLMTPKAGTQFERKYSDIAIWADVKTGMPKRIETTDKSGMTVRGVDLDNVRLNVPIPDSTFQLPAINASDWTRVDEPYRE